MSGLSKFGEKALVAELIRLFDPEGNKSVGDDCGILEQGNEYLLMTTDMISESTHIPKGSRPEDIGWYAAAVNLSDIAAMGGTPMGMLFALGLPKETEKEWLEALASGMKECSDSFGVPVLGGDTKENPSITIAGTAFGRVPKSQILRRGGARPGDILAMTGKLGRNLLWERTGDPAHMLRIAPRIAEGRMLAESGAVTSCIDMSDGLSTSLHHLARASGLGFGLDFDSLPLPEGLGDADRERAIHSGGDYELLFTLDPAMADSLLNRKTDIRITRLGAATEREGVFMHKGGKTEPLPDRGWEHFRRQGI